MSSNGNYEKDSIDFFNNSGFRIPIAFLKKKLNTKKEFKSDLELTEGKNPFYEKLFNTKDKFDTLLIPQHSQWFTNDKKFLKETQKLLKTELPAVPEYKDIMFIRDGLLNEDNLLDKYTYFEWDKIKFLNKNQQIMQYFSLYNISSPVLSLCLPIILLIIPFFIIKCQGHKITWSEYYKFLKLVLKNHSLGQIFNIQSASWDKRMMIFISIGFYVMQIYFNFYSCIKFIRNMKHMHYTIFGVRDYLKASIESMKKTTNGWHKFSTYKEFNNKNKLIIDKATILYNELNNISNLKWTSTKFFDIGKAMRAFYMINLDKDWNSTIDYCVYYNVYISNITNIKEQMNNKLNYCKYAKKTSFKDIYYPHISSSEIVHNDVKLDNNLIITGPNAAGKTTLLKSVILNVLVSQQFGCGYYKSANIKPYDVLSSYINIPDTSARDSLFQAEAGRCKHILDDILKNKNKKHLCIFDELYSGTNPYEATSAAVGYLKFIGNKNNVTYILTTHYLDLCNMLDKEDNVENLQMQVETKEKDFVYTYKIINGISKIKGGIKVLKDLNYPDEILKECNSYLSHL